MRWLVCLFVWVVCCEVNCNKCVSNEWGFDIIFVVFVLILLINCFVLLSWVLIFVLIFWYIYLSKDWFCDFLVINFVLVWCCWYISLMFFVYFLSYVNVMVIKFYIEILRLLLVGFLVIVGKLIG